MTGTDTAAAPAPAAQKSFAALHHPGYRIYFICSALAMMADGIEHVISYWVAYQKFESPALGGFAVLSHWLPFLFFSVFSGMLADRFDPRRIIQLGMAGFMGASLLWGYFLLTDTLQIWEAGAILVLHGFSGVLWQPASQLLIHDIVGPALLPSAVRLNATSRWLGLLAAPAIGGALMLAVGPTVGIFMNALIYLPLVLWLIKAPYGPKFRKEGAGPRPAIRGFADVAATFRTMASIPTLFSMTLLAGCAAGLVGNSYHAQMPGFARDLGHGNAGVAYSMLLAADATGALIAGFLLESTGFLKPRPRIALALAMVWAAALACFGLAPSYPIALGCLFVAGFVELSYNAMSQTLVQLNAPGEIRGRVIGVYNMFSLGMRSISGVTVGLGGALIGIHSSLIISAGALIIVIAALIAYLRRVRPVPAT